MVANKAEWKTNEALAVGKGATVQEFVAQVAATDLKLTWRRGAKVT